MSDRYKILVATTIPELEQLVDNHLQAGWSIIGGISVAPHSAVAVDVVVTATEYNLAFFQAVGK